MSNGRFRWPPTFGLTELMTVPSLSATLKVRVEGARLLPVPWK
jgi:hypothetical protein